MNTLKKTEQELATELIAVIQHDLWRMNILRVVRSLNLNDCWIGAGFVRNKIWDVKHNMERTTLNDIDVIHFDANKANQDYDLEIENELKRNHPNLNWSAKNQARMHIRNHQQPYQNCLESISFWPETATAVAIRINHQNQLEYIAPHGLEDLFDLIVSPTPGFNLTIYKGRIEQKQWKKQWKELDIRLE